MAVAYFRNRGAVQQVPADHPSVIALLALNPTVDPAAHKAMIEFCNGDDPLLGRQVLATIIDGNNHDLLVRDVYNGNLVTIVIEMDDHDPAFGGYHWGDIAATAPRYNFSDDVAALVLAMADSPWVG